MDNTENFIRVCSTFDCPVIAYQIKTYPDKINQACPSCGKIGVRQR